MCNILSIDTCIMKIVKRATTYSIGKHQELTTISTKKILAAWILEKEKAEPHKSQAIIIWQPLFKKS